MPITTKPSGRRTYVPPPDFVATARFRALARSSKYMNVTVIWAEAIEGNLASYIEIWVRGDNDGPETRFGLWTRNWEAPSAVWRDLPVIHQLCDIAGRSFRSLAEMAEGLPGLRFQATCVLDSLALSNLEMLDLIAAAPVQGAADASAP